MLWSKEWLLPFGRIQEIYKNSLTSPLKNIEIRFYSNELDINQHDASKSWKILKHIIGIQGENYSQKKTFSNDNVLID